jgi:4-amino-4-deoxy-L-arabinose transferase-like glycosyltransferase
MVAVVLRLVGLYSLFRWRPWAVVDPVMSGGEVVQIARSIVWGKGFGNPIGGFETGPTAWICPVYPYIIAAIFKLEGIYTVRSRLVLLGLNCLFAGLTILPIYGIARRTFGRETAVIASWLWVVLPSAWQIPIRLMWDSALTALSLAVIVWATLAIRGQRRLLTWAGYGALWAFGALANAAILILAPFVFGWLLWDLRKQSASWFKPLAIAALIFALGLAPWTLRNYMVFGKVVLIRSNLGLVLWMAHHPGPPGFNGGMSPYSDRHQTALYQQMGEMEYMKAKKREAYSFMASHPGQTLSMAVGNAGTLWFGVTDRAANPWYGGARYLSIDFLANTAVILFALAGIVLALRARNTTAPLYLSIVLFFPLIYYLTRPALRFRFAFEPVLTVLAAYGAAQIFGCITQRRSNATVGSAVA